MTKPSWPMVAQTLGFILLVALVLFGAAGRIDIPLFWAYLGVLAAVSTAGLFLIDEDLARERMRPGGHPPGLRLYFIFLLCVAHWTIAGLDRRFHWSDTVPLSLRVAALVVFAAGLALFGCQNTTGARAPNRHRRPLSLGAPSRVCRRDPRHRGERHGPLLMARHSARRSRSAAPPVADNHRGPHLAHRIARLRRIHPTGALAVAPRLMVNAAAPRSGPVGKKRLVSGGFRCTHTCCNELWRRPSSLRRSVFPAGFVGIPNERRLFQI